MRMQRIAALAACVALASCGGSPSQAAREPVATAAIAAPFVGTWLLDPTASTMAGIRITFSGDPSGGMETGYNGTHYRFRLDGKEYDAYGMQATWRTTGERTWETVYRVKGVVNNTDHFTLAADGRHLSLVTDRAGPPPTQERYEFERDKTRPDLIGEWRGSMASDDEVGFVIGDAVGDRVHVRTIPQPAAARLSTDGTLAPMLGPPSVAPEGAMVGFKVTGPRTFVMSQQLAGQPVVPATYTLSEDGRTLVGHVLAGPTPDSSDRLELVYRKR